MEIEKSIVIKNLAYLAILLLAACSRQQPETVTITGRVTDFDGNPLDSVTVGWMNPAFDGQYYTTTDSDGRYCARIPKGRYASAGGLNMSEYVITGSTLPEAEQRLEYWHWNYIADRDTVSDFRYHRLEVYGIHAFQIPGGTPGFMLYFRPMSLTRFQTWVRAGRPAGDNALTPPLDSARIEVTIDGDSVPIRLAQPVKEYFDNENWSGAYLLFVDRPAKHHPVKTFRIVMKDLSNGDKGEGSYTLEGMTRKDYVWPEGDIDATKTR